MVPFCSAPAGHFHSALDNNSLASKHSASTYSWTAWDGHFADLGAVTIPEGGDQLEYVSQPFGVSDNGSVVTGESGVARRFAMIWTAQTGMMYMTDYLTMKGVTDHKSWLILTTAVWVSPDGRMVVGQGFYPGSPFALPKSWIVTLR